MWADGSESICNFEDIIDSCEIIARIEFLTELSQDQIIDEAELDELATLLDLQDQADNSPDWRYGESLIRDSYFKDYCQELAEDCGMISGDEGWPLNCIDWDQAADELKYDYFSVDFDGIEYWIRS